MLGCSLPLFELQVSGEHVIVAKNISLFVNDHSPHLSTPLQLQQYRLKVAARSSGPNLTQRSETTQPEKICLQIKCQTYNIICDSVWDIYKMENLHSS